MKSLRDYIFEESVKEQSFKTTWNKFWHLRLDKKLNDKLSKDDFEELDRYAEKGIMAWHKDSNSMEEISVDKIFKDFNNNDKISVKTVLYKGTREFEITYKGNTYIVDPIQDVNELKFEFGDGDQAILKFIKKISSWI